MIKADLHMHSTASDGVYAPDELMRRAASLGFTHVALTDHDSMEGLAPAAKAAVEATRLPVTVKIRAGWDETCINAVEVAQICEQAGAKAVAVHARTRMQQYSGHADWKIIRAL